jgi:hypothetical protein
VALWAVLATSTAEAAPTRHFLYELGESQASKPFNKPCGVTVDSYGNVYLSQANNLGEIDVFNPAGEFLTRIEDGHDPCSIAVDSAGNLYVLERWSSVSDDDIVVMYAAPSPYPPTVGAKYGAPTKTIAIYEETELKTIAVNPANDHVLVSKGSKISEYKSAAEGSGLINDTIGKGLIFPSFGIDVEAASGDVYVARNPEGRVRVLDPPGDKVLRECPEFPSPGLGSLQNITLDQESGDLLVFLQAEGLIEEFDPACKEVESARLGPQFGAAATSLKGAALVDLAVDNGKFSPNKGNLYVVSGESAKPRLYAYGPLEEPRPEVETGKATEATSTSATFNGTVDPNGLVLKDCHFDYVGEAAFEAGGFATAATVPCAESLAEIGSGKEPVAVHAQVSGLAPGAYRFRLAAENENPPPVTGKAVAFGPPTIATKAAFPVFYAEATVRARINPEGFGTTYRVEYGTSDAYGQSSAEASLSSGEAGIEVAVSLSGLEPATSYHYRVLATNAVGTTTGPDQTLSTLARPPAQKCPNAQFRTGPSAALPDCRVYELVTPPVTNGSSLFWETSDAINGNFPTALASADGDSVIFGTIGTLPGTEGNGIFDGHRSVRGPEGWSESLFSPSGEQTSVARTGGVSPDHLYSFWSASGETGSLDSPEGEGHAHYIRLPGGVANPACSPEPQGHFEWIGCGSLGADSAAWGRWITAGAGHVVFTSTKHLEPNAPEEDTLAIYDRTPGGPTQVVSLLPEAEVPTAPAEYRGISADGSAVAFVIEEAGTPRLYEHRSGEETLEVSSGETTFAGLSKDGSRLFYVKGGALYAFDASTQESTEIAAGDAAFVNVSADGSHVYFTSTGALTGTEENEGGEAAEAGEDNFYLWEAETQALRFLGVLDHSDVSGGVNLARWVAGLDPNASGGASGPAIDPSRSTPNGEVLVFQSHAPLTGYDSEGYSEVFRYDATDGSLVCLSCSPIGAPAQSDAELQSAKLDSSLASSGLVRIANVSEDGQTVFFQTSDALVPVDVNGAGDVYEWREGQLSLISSGRSSIDSFLYGVSADGKNVFFSTREGLVPEDEADGGVSIYDARVGGGFAASPGKQGCEGEACQGAPNGAPTLLPPVPTVAPGSAGNEAPRHVCPKGKHKVRRAGKTRCLGKYAHRRHHKKHEHHRGGRATR